MTRQHDQIYSNKFGPPIGRPGNGLGDVWGGVGDPESLSFPRQSRPCDATGSPETSPEDESDSYIEPDWNLLYGALKVLSAKQSFVIRLRYGFADGTCYTLDEIAHVMGVSHQAVSDLEQRGLRALQTVVTGEQ